MKNYRTLRPIVIGDTMHDKGVVIELIDKQAAALMAAGHIEAVDGGAVAAKEEDEVKPARTKATAKDVAQ